MSITATQLIQDLAGISQILLVIGLYVAWRQLSTTVKDIQSRVKREAGMIAIEEADKFAEEILPNFDKINKKFGGLTEINKLESFVPSEINGVNQQKYKSRLEQMDKTEGLEDMVLALTNKIESIATAFTKGVANEEVIFEAVGPVYCSMIEALYFFYCHYRRNGEHISPYQNTINLYNTWKARISKISMESTKKSLDVELRRATEKSTPVNLLGTV